MTHIHALSAAITYTHYRYQRHTCNVCTNDTHTHTPKSNNTHYLHQSHTRTVYPNHTNTHRHQSDTRPVYTNHIVMSHVQIAKVDLYMDESCHTYECVMWNKWMSHVSQQPLSTPATYIHALSATMTENSAHALSTLTKHISTRTI